MRFRKFQRMHPQKVVHEGTGSWDTVLFLGELIPIDDKIQIRGSNSIVEVSFAFLLVLLDPLVLLVDRY